MEYLKELLSGSEARAVDLHIARCTIPFVIEDDEHAGILGSGNLFEVCGRAFILTASHSFKDFDPDRVGVPAVTDKGRRTFLTLGGCRRYYWPDDSLDVTIIEIPAGSLQESLRRAHSFIAPSSLASTFQLFPQYVIAGYPKVAAAVSSGHIEPRPVKITTTPYAGKTPENFRADREFLLTFEEYGVTPDGTVQPSIELFGISGAAVWGVVPPNEISGLWSPRSAVRVVGVQVAYEPTSYVRCHQWWLFARLFEQIDPVIGAEVMRALGIPRPSGTTK